MSLTTDNFSRPSLLPIAVLLSVSSHLLLLYSQLPTLGGFGNHQPPPESAPIEVSELPPEYYELQKKMAEQNRVKPKPSETQIAETERADNNKPDPNAKFLSDRNQTVQNETKAAQVDKFREKLGTGLKQDETEGTAKTPAVESEAEFATGEKPGTGTEKKDWKTLSLQDLGISGNGLPAGATDDHLDHVAAGERTLLSTREFRYFSYYHRIKELLRQHWKPSVEEKLTHLWGKGKTVNSDEFTTRVLVLLNEKGSVQKVSRVTSCGINELDEAAVEAFQKAAPFPNPPAGIVDPDGFVRIRWDFILQMESAPKIQFETVRRIPN